MQQMLRVLGSAANEPEERTTDVCMEAAARSLEDLVGGKRFRRHDALELLAIDALTTYAFEHASQSASSTETLEELANRGAGLFAQIAERG
jgi:hypothetical protein